MAKRNNAPDWILYLLISLIVTIFTLGLRTYFKKRKAKKELNNSKTVNITAIELIHTTRGTKHYEIWGNDLNNQEKHIIVPKTWDIFLEIKNEELNEGDVLVQGYDGQYRKQGKIYSPNYSNANTFKQLNSHGV